MSGSLGYSVLAIPAGIPLPVGTIAAPPPPTTPALSAPSLSAARKPIYISPSYQYDSQAGVLVLQLRDTATGAVTEQIPTQAQLEQYRYSGAPNVEALIAHATA